MEKIQEMAQNHLTLGLYGTSGKYNFCFRFGRKEPFCFVTPLRPQAMPKPSAMVMRLRKYLANQRIIAVVPQYWKRKVWLMITRKPELVTSKAVWLCLDLVEGASLHFFNDDEFPEPEIIQWPNPSEIQSSLDNWKAWPTLTPALRKLITVMDNKEAEALMADLEDGVGDVFFYTDNMDRIVKISPWPLLASQKQQLHEHASENIIQVFEKAGYDIVLRELYEAKEKNYKIIEQRKIAKLKKTLAKIEEDRQRLLSMIELENIASLISANLWCLNPSAKIDILELENDSGINSIKLDKRFTILQNMNRMFHSVRRGKRGLKILQERRDVILAEIEKGEWELPEAPVNRNLTSSIDKNLPVSISKHIKRFTSSDGYYLLMGRDAKGNKELRKLASGHDLWVHVKEGPGAHVIIRRPHIGHEPPISTLVEAGQLAAKKSWLSNAKEAEVMFAEVRHVKPDRSRGEGKVLLDRIWRVMTVALN